ncbi:MAG: cobalamin-binding protein [Proteobacteria bacterium]|nr:cobalamin-binding protein [Pseudomonadota bacterium]
MDSQRREEILKRLRDGVVEYDEDRVRTAAQTALDEGLDALEAVMNGLAAGMEIAGDLYDKQEYFVPELLMCADAFYAGLDILRPHIRKQGRAIRGQVVIGTVQGDVHDIGKNLVKLMFDTAGFHVHDLGRDVPLEKFVEEQLRTESEIVAISAMMTTTMVGMKKVVQMIREKNSDTEIILGGAPVTKDVAVLFGADGFAGSAGDAVGEAIKMVRTLRKMENKKRSRRKRVAKTPRNITLNNWRDGP